MKRSLTDTKVKNFKPNGKLTKRQTVAACMFTQQPEAASLFATTLKSTTNTPH
jgi:hypothetical protein